MNELDYLLLFVILVGVAIGLRRGLMRILISIVGVYPTVLVAGYVYEPVGRIVSEALGLGRVAMDNLAYLVAIAAMTAVVELASHMLFESTRLPALGRLDDLFGGFVGGLYGALWASLLLVPIQYGVAWSGGAWTEALYESALLPTLNEIFRNGVLEIVRVLFLNDLPPLYHPAYLI
jgi:uncharacterized membrane protein required for colicin V production